MKRLLLSTSCALMTSISLQAQEIINVDFSSYADGAIAGTNGWVTGGTHSIVNGELQITGDASDILYSGAGATVQVGDRVQITMDHYVQANFYGERAHGQLFSFGLQTNATVATGSSSDRIYPNIYLWGAELNRMDGTVSVMPDQTQWSVNPIALDALDDCGFNPFGYDAVSGTDMADEVITRSEDFRTVYTVTKSHVENLFNVEVTTSNSLTGTLTTSLAEIEHAGLWEASTYYLFLDGINRVGLTNMVKSIKVERLDPVIAVPAGVSALGLDQEVSLSWNIMPGATNYYIYRTQTAGDYAGVTPIETTSESYLDQGLTNETTYYYSIVAAYHNGTSAMSAEVAVTPKQIYIDESVISTTFSAETAGSDLADSADWNAISGSGSNAFTVVDNAGTQYVDTTPTTADFDAAGNAVYLDRLLRNDEDDTVEGYMDISVSVDGSVITNPDGAVFGNNGVLDFGLTSDTVTPLDPSGTDSALFHLYIRFGMNMGIIFGGYGTTTELAYLSREEANWNPKLNNWNSGGGGLDYETDKIRIRWKLRKSRVDGYYQAWVSMSNMVSGVVDSGTVEFDTAEMPEMYNAVASLFTFGHSAKAKQAENEDLLQVQVYEVGINHIADVKPIASVPNITSVVSGDRSVILEWDPIFECIGYSIEMVDPRSELEVVVQNYQESSYTDEPRWNGEMNTYTLYAHFDADAEPTDVTSTSTNGQAVALQPVCHAAEDDWATTSLTFGMDGNWEVEGDIIYVDRTEQPFFTQGVDNYTGPTLYGILQGPALTGSADAGVATNDWLKIEALASGPGSIAFGGSGQIWNYNPFRRLLAYSEVSDLDFEGAASFDATTSALYMKVRTGPGGWTNGNNGGLYTAIRNGNTWYVTANPTPIVGGNGSAPSERVALTPDVDNEEWNELNISNPGTRLSPGTALSDTSVLTNITAVGFLVQDVFSGNITEFEVQTSGALPSYDYWAEGFDGFTNAAPELDADGDGVINELEYAYNGDPTDPENVGTLPKLNLDAGQTEPGSGDDVFTYVYIKQRNPDAGITYNLKATENLTLGWEPATYTSVEENLNYYWTVVTNYIPVTADQTFITVEVE
ncbi:fibronectin type III domain-containing protein [Verrucomicrobia bacterium S94]|nr:fibronectin type III domain-containing protein [Verrucomicrobia bacterium S94]